tara:strand:+ start:22063 stop:22608 length:546 start_codon:yes stop_codon:yes gene_type:complete
MKDKDTQFLFESYEKSLTEGRKKQFEDRVRKTVIDPDTGEERKESYYEMMMRIKGIRGGAGARSRDTRYKKASQGKVALGKRKFKVADKAYETPLKGLQKDIISFVEVTPTTAKEIIDFGSKIFDKDEVENIVKDMIINGLLDEVFGEEEPQMDEVDPDKLGEIEAFQDFTAETETDLEDY